MTASKVGTRKIIKLDAQDVEIALKHFALEKGDIYTLKEINISIPIDSHLKYTEDGNLIYRYMPSAENSISATLLFKED